MNDFISKWHRELEIFDKIKEIHPDLVLTHHPLIYGYRSKVFKRDPSKKELCEALEKEQIIVQAGEEKPLKYSPINEVFTVPVGP